MEAAPALEATLDAMSVKDLKRRCRALGVAEEAIEDLDDRPDVKIAAKALVLAAEETRRAASAAGAAPGGTPAAPGGAPRLGGAEVAPGGAAFYPVTSFRGGGERTTWRRFSEFAALRKLLGKQHPGRKGELDAVPFPKKTKLKSRGKKDKVVSARRELLGTWLASAAALFPEEIVLEVFLCPDLQPGRHQSAASAALAGGPTDEDELLQLAAAHRQALQQQLSPQEGLPPHTSPQEGVPGGAAAPVPHAPAPALAPSPAATEPEGGGGLAGLEEERAQVLALKFSELQRRASACGHISTGELSAACDAEHPQAAIAELILRGSGAAEAEAEAEAERRLLRLRQELAPLKLTALQQRARTLGCAQEELDAAGDSCANPRDGILELVLARAARRRQQPPPPPGGGAAAAAMAKPHHRPPPAATTAAATVLIPVAPSSAGAPPDDALAPVVAVAVPSPPDGVDVRGQRPCLGGGGGDRHVMISYSWDYQPLAIQTCRAMQQRGIPTWMDIDGGMQSDIYDSMADGVSKSACVVALLGQSYQDSANCKLGKAHDPA
jgi:hypothetical protein